jgi:hypothetical protein
MKHVKAINLDDAGWPQRLGLGCMKAAIAVKAALAAGMFAALVWLASGAPARAGTISLTDGNSQVTLDPSSPAGVSGWTVDNVNQLFQQWFWYRIGSSGPQFSIDTLGLSSSAQVTQSQASVTYSGSNGLTIKVTYSLEGGAQNSGAADLGESISITNTSSSSQDVHFYQFSNFTLDTPTTSSSAAQDIVQFQNSNAVDQHNGSETLAETVITPKPNYRETGFVPNLLNEITNNPAYQLNEVNNNSPDVAKGPGDVSWAYEWDRTIAPNSTFIISKDKALSGVVQQPTPEPSTLVLLTAGVLSLAVVARRRLHGA